MGLKRNIAFIIDRDSKDYTGLTYSFIRAFKKNGCECDLISFNINRNIYKTLGLFPVIKTRYVAYHQGEILKAVRNTNSNIIFVIKGYFLLPETIDKIKGMHKIIVCFNPDDPFSSIFGSSNLNIRSSIGYYDAYFIWHKQLIQKAKDAGCKQVFYLPFAADTEIITPSTNNIIDQPYAVSFVGNADKERKSFIKELSAILRGWNEPKALFGHDWKEVEGFNSMGAVLGSDYLNAMHNTKINLNILRKQNKNSHNMRTFEIPAAGGFMLHEYSDEAADFFNEGVEAEFFHDAEECADKIRYYFKNDDLRDKIAKAGYEKIFSAGYTYTNLVKVIQERVDEIIQNSK